MAEGGKAGEGVSGAERHLVVEWEGGRRYRGGEPGGVSLLVDGAREIAPGPVDALLIALASCSAIDVVDILEKRRTPVNALRVRLDAVRATTVPRRVLSVKLRFEVATASEAHHVERAVALSLEKYCSVTASLRDDVQVEAEIMVVPPGDGAA
jgi:putative redox protein